MYQAYWGLSRSPFRGHLDPRWFHEGPTQEEALARLHFLVEERRTLGLVLGEAGAGKSMLLEVFSRQLATARVERALVNLVSLDRHELLWLLAGQLGVECLKRSELALHRSLDEHIRANRYQQISTVLLLDDADEASPEALDEIARLAQLTQAQDTGLTIVLGAQAERLGRLGLRILELAELRVDLEGWDDEETAAFVKGSLAAAGRTTPIFSEPAMQRLHELTSGIPRRIKQLADLALVCGAGTNLAQIEPDLIEAVYQELGVQGGSLPAAIR